MKLHLAVCVFFIVQILLNTFIAITNRDIALFIIHLILTAVALIAYIIVHLRNPGKLQAQLQNDNSNAIQIQNQMGPITNRVIKQQQQVKENQQPKTKKQLQQCTDHQSPQINPSKRLCRLCKIEQPFRTKHCYDCNECIATFDHHCPWMANCIGQKNRSLFIIYLIVQILQTCTGLILCFQSASHLNKFKTQQIVLGTFLSLVFAGLSGLLLFHVYLMMMNLTTWQFAKWEKIWYFKGRQRSLGSPFYRSIWQNTKQYWQVTFSLEKKVWQLVQQQQI